MELTPSILFTIAIIMIATYTCNAIIFPEDSSNYIDNYDKFGGITGTDWSFDVWLDINFDHAYQKIFNGVDFSKSTVYSVITITYINQHYSDSMIGWDKSHQGIFDTYDYQTEGAGKRWYNSDWVQDTPFFSLEHLFGTSKAQRINQDYHKYLQDIGVEDRPEGNLFETIGVLLTNVWQGFTQLVRLLTFTNIPNMPLWVLGILNVFFIPMWIVLIIGIAPYVMDMIKTLSSIIEPWIPW